MLRTRGLWCRQSRPSREEPPACLLGQHRREAAWRPPRPRGWRHSGASVHTRQGSSPVVGPDSLQATVTRSASCPGSSPMPSPACPSHLSGKRLWAPQTILPFFIKTFQRAVFGSQENSAESTEPSPISWPTHSLSPPAASLMNMLHLMSLSQHLSPPTAHSPHQAQGRCCASWGPGRTQRRVTPSRLHSGSSGAVPLSPHPQLRVSTRVPRRAGCGLQRAGCLDCLLPSAMH